MCTVISPISSCSRLNHAREFVDMSPTVSYCKSIFELLLLIIPEGVIIGMINFIIPIYQWYRLNREFVAHCVVLKMQRIIECNFRVHPFLCLC